jgi:hypothetical protein
MIKHQNPTPQFAICIDTNVPDLLTPRMVYQVLPDERASRSKYVRVMDNEGQDYLYPADCFVFIDVPQPAERVLLTISLPMSQDTPAEYVR